MNVELLIANISKHISLTAEEVDFVIAEVVRHVERLRALSPDYEMAQAGRRSGVSA